MAPIDTSHLVLDKHLSVLDLFSGAGGTGLGFRRAGFRIVGAVEINVSAAETYEKNLGIKVKLADIRELDPKEFRLELGLEKRELGVLVGCPPCQGFSRMRNNQGINDERNSLVLKYLEYLEEFLPLYAVFENVPGLTRTTHGRVFYNQLLTGIKRLGYQYKEQDQKVADFGVAQRRKRIIVIISRDGKAPPIPEPTHAKKKTLFREEWITVQQVIGNNKYPTLQAGENGEHDGLYPNHIAPDISQKVLKFIQHVPHDGGGRKDIPREYWLQCHISHDGHADVYGRLAWNSLANTITAGCTNLSKGRFVHPEQDRALTSREAAALQGFPDEFRFYGTDWATQIGNAVPPPLAYAIAIAIKNQISSLSAVDNNDKDASMDISRTLEV